MPRARVSVQVEFCAAYRLAMEGATDEENRAAFGVCFSRNFHGHDYLLRMTVEGEVDHRTGMVADYAALDRLLEEEVFRPLDHRNLNLDVPFLTGVVPTSENLCVHLWPRLADALPEGCALVELRLREGRDHEVAYLGPKS